MKMGILLQLSVMEDELRCFLTDLLILLGYNVYIVHCDTDVKSFNCATTWLVYICADLSDNLNLDATDKVSDIESFLF